MPKLGTARSTCRQATPLSGELAVRAERCPQQLAGGKNLRLRNAARVNHVDTQVVDQLVLDQRPELPLVRELLPAAGAAG